MYFKKLYDHNKILFVIILMFVFAQLFNNIRRDAAISPIYAYGMYSAIIKPKNYYIVPQIQVNGKPLESKNFSPQQWDKIELPLHFFRSQQQFNYELYATHIQPLLGVNDSSKYINQLTPTQFDKWYKKYLTTFLPETADSIQVIWQQYFFTGTSLLLHSKYEKQF
jgi:hypothetical protein